MKILKLYREETLKNKKYGTNSPLMKVIREKYKCDEIVLRKNCPEQEYAELIRGYDVLLTMWQSPHIPNELAQNPGKLKYICHITGELAAYMDLEIIESPYLTVTNWGDAPAYKIAEGAFALLMAVMKDIPLHIKNARENGWDIPEGQRQVSLFQKRVGIYGMGVIGRQFLKFLMPFESDVYVFDPYIKELPEGVKRVNSLKELFQISQIVVIHAALTKETEKSVTGELLAMLPDGGILINTARGQIVDFEALKKELMSNRLRAGLDMAQKNSMPDEDDPVRFLDNAICSAHRIGYGDWEEDSEVLDKASLICLDNLERFSEGKELKFIMTPERYRIST